MAKSLSKRILNIYSNFMKYTIQNTLLNILLTLLENLPIIVAIDLMFSNDDVLTKLFTPFYFLSPTLYLELLNEKFSNECNTVLNEVIEITVSTENIKSTLNTTISKFHDYKFFNTVLISVDKSYCLYNDILIYLSIITVLIIFLLFTFLALIDARKPTILRKTVSFIITNFLNLILRPFSVVILAVLFNKPLILLYKNAYIIDSYFTTQIGLTIISVIFIILFCVTSFLYIKYINNAYFFEKFPYDYYSKSDGLILLVIKIFVAFKLNFEKLSGLKHVFFVNLILGIFIYIRLVVAISNSHYIINHISIKNIRNYLSVFFALQILLKLINQSSDQLINYTDYVLYVELIIIIICVLWMGSNIFNSTGKTFSFINREDFIEEIFHFFYYIKTHIKNKKDINEEKKRTESVIDNIIIGHKMKCTLDECILCGEDIYNPDLKTLYMILYQQFNLFEKDLKEEDEGICVILRLIFLKVLDEKKIHRISLVVLKNAKISFHTHLKIYHLYNDLLDEINHDLKNLLTIKYGECYDELLQILVTFEEILGFIKSRTEKVELVINKTNHVGSIFKKLQKDLFKLKRNKRIYFDPSNMLQIICIIRLLFQKNIDTELTENLEYNFQDFLEGVDKIFEENISFLVRYDFSNYIWRIKKIPKKFIDMTQYKIKDLIDQSVEKVFPHFMGKNIIKKLEDLVLSNIIDQNIVFKTYICDAETNVKYVKFDIDIVPNLEGNYILMMHCHFHKRQLLIVDEYGNFVNGSEVLYEKIGINAEMVTASKGKINMYNVFNIPKTSKLDEIKIVSISDEGLLDTTKNVFLFESDIQAALPEFLAEYLNFKKKNEKLLVYLNLFETMKINEVKYFVFTIKINSNDDEKKKKNGVDFNLNKTIEKYEKRFTNPGGHTVQRRESVTSSELNAENNNLINTKNITNDPSTLPTSISIIPQGTLKKGGTRKFYKKTLDNDDSKKDDNNPKDKDNLNTYQNYLEYYNYFYDTHRSASVTIDNANNLNSQHSSMNNTVNSDLFSFLLIKNANEKKRSNKFRNFLYCIYIFNFCLVLLGIISIIFLYSYSDFVNRFIDNYQSFNTFRSRVYSTTANFFTIIRFDENLKMNETYFNDDEENYFKVKSIQYYNYNDYIKKEIFKNNIPNNFDYDFYFKMNMNFHAENIMLELNKFFNSAYSFFGQSLYNDKINYKTDFIFFNSIGNYMIRQEYLKNAFGLFSLTSNEIATNPDMKIYLNISYFDFVTSANTEVNSNTPSEIYVNELSTTDYNTFQSKINIYQYLFNYFSVFYNKINEINDFFFTYGNDHFNKLQTDSKALLILIIILNIIFVLISFISILIYKRILVTEFNTLYSINEEHVNKLKEKFRYVRELIKQEHFPSKIYNQLRKMKEVESSQFISNRPRETSKHINSQLKVKSSNTITMDENESVITTNDTGLVDIYLGFAGAKSILQRSYTSKIKTKIEKIKKESSRAQASNLLLSRLNFDFDLITIFIYFIVFMTLFYLLMGFAIIYMLEDKFLAMKTSFQYSNLFLTKNSDLYNYYITIKLSIMLNKNNPFTINCANCNLNNSNNFDLLLNFNNRTEELNKMESAHPFLSDLYNNRKLYNSTQLCDELYNKPNDLIDYLNANTILGKETTFNLNNLCKQIPILQSNADTVFTNIIVQIRKIYNNFIFDNKNTLDRIKFLQNDFMLVDTLFGIFVEPYLSYIKHVLIVKEISDVKNDYFNFIVAIFFVNILIDFVMLIYIWFKIYKQIIRSVNNMNLVTDSVSMI